MFDNFSFEALAHYTRGMAMMFFVMCAIMTYGWRKRNNMAFLLFITICYIAVGYIKDILFLFPYFDDNRFAENLSSIFDVSCTPFICAFFLETTRPGMLNKRIVFLVYSLFAIFIPIYIIYPSERVVFAVYILAALTALYTLALIPFNVIRYNKILTENLSYTKDVSVNWILLCVLFYFLWLSVYAVSFWDATWLGEAVFDIYSILAFGIMCLLSRNHRVFVDMFNKEEENHTEKPADSNEKVNRDNNKKEQTDDGYKSRTEDFIAAALMRCMETEKLYLNPLLSLNDLAMAAGTNKTYISTFINSRGKTFYDYVNEFRISEACRIMETSDERLAMADIAIRSGFNSMSSFNRYFLKIKGITPTGYYHRRA